MLLWGKLKSSLLTSIRIESRFQNNVDLPVTERSLSINDRSVPRSDSDFLTSQKP